MRTRVRSRHVIDLIFPISLFFVFAVSALSVLILAGNIYASTSSRLRVNDENRTALSYIAEKIRQNDSGGAIDITLVDNTECLAISAVYHEVSCTTYIYVYDGMLKELFINDGIPVNLKSGRDIMELASLSVEALEDHLFHFTAVDSQGTESTLTVSERSTP